MHKPCEPEQLKRLLFKATTVAAAERRVEGQDAGILGAGPAYGGPGSVGGAVTCRIFNFGTSTVSITTRQIFTNTNVSIPLASDTCNVALGVAKYCAFTARITGNLAYSCRVIAVGTETHISGVAEIQLPNGSISTTLPLSK